MESASPSSQMTAVCYRCFYRGPATETQRCPACDFALITEAADPTKEIHLADVLDRYSVRDGAPKLPGLLTHPGFLPRMRTVATGTTPPPDEDDGEIAEAIITTLAAGSVAEPLPVQGRPLVVELEAEPPPQWPSQLPSVPRVAPKVDATPAARGGTAVSEPAGFSTVAVIAVVVAALATGVGVAFLTLAL